MYIEWEENIPIGDYKAISYTYRTCVHNYDLNMKRLYFKIDRFSSQTIALEDIRKLAYGRLEFLFPQSPAIELNDLKKNIILTIQEYERKGVKI